MMQLQQQLQQQQQQHLSSQGVLMVGSEIDAAVTAKMQVSRE